LSDLSALLDAARNDPQSAWSPIGDAAGYALARAGFSSTVEALWRAMQADALFTPFQNIDWCLEWTSRPGGGEPVIVIAMRDGEPELLFPFARSRAMGGKSLQWLAQDHNDYGAPLMRGKARTINSATAGIILEKAVRAVPGTDFAFLASQPKTIEGQINPFATWRGETFSTSAHSMTLEGGWKETYERSRGSNTRKHEAKKLKRLRKEGPLGLVRVRGRANVTSAMDRAMGWKRNQLATMGASDPFGDGQMQAALTALAANDKLVRLYELRSNGRTIAASICLGGPASQNHFITVYDPDYSLPVSPGTQMMNKLTELFARAGYAIFDFSAGDEPYKLKVCDTTTGMTFAVRPLTVYGHFAAQLVSSKVHLRRWAKSQPAVFDGVHKARRLFRTLMKRRPARMQNAEQH
jgi:CelD/BcsL family acetyltransferase involved in cellulose biosynthesis